MPIRWLIEEGGAASLVAWGGGEPKQYRAGFYAVAGRLPQHNRINNSNNSMDFFSLHIAVMMMLAGLGEMPLDSLTFNDFTAVDGIALRPTSIAELKIQAHYHRLVAQLPKNPQATLDQIEGPHRKLLALRYYLNRQGSLKSEWTWTRSQFERFKRSGSYRKAIAEVERVKAMFAQLNPGYTLGTTLEARPLEDQVNSWNTVPSVERAASALYRQLMRAALDSSLNIPPDSADLQTFRQQLQNAKLESVPTVAVPGMSQHGQLRAFDFVVKQGGAIVAGTNAGAVRSRWDSPGWTKKLQEAIRAASSSFSGPLRSPYEPWHYTYNR